MRTVKELSNLTGISVRALHYYDEIGLLEPTDKSEAGYRLYDDKALETLRQILFFREFDIPLKEIKAIMNDPALEKNQILQMQRDMLETKKRRVERLISGIDDILRGEDKMDFAIFNQTEIEDMFCRTYERMPEEIWRMAELEFGSKENWKKHYVEAMSAEGMQKKFAKVLEWYGGKSSYVGAFRYSLGKDAAESYGQRVEAVLAKLAEKRDRPVDSFEVKELVGEYGFVMKQLTQVRDESGMMRYLAWFQNSEPARSRLDGKYGAGRQWRIGSGKETGWMFLLQRGEKTLRWFWRK